MQALTETCPSPTSFDLHANGIGSLGLSTKVPASSVVALARRRRSQGKAAASRVHVTETTGRRTKPSSSTTKFSFKHTTATGPGAINGKKEREMASSATPKTIALPRHLARPMQHEIDEAVIAAIEPELADTPMEYIREVLQVAGPSMLTVLANSSSTPVKTSLPKEIVVTVNDISSDMPTHMLAIHSRQSTATKQKVTLLPIHNIMLAAHCAHLPPLPPSKPGTPESVGGSITLPVVPLSIPSLETFPHLCTYLYTQRADHLLAFLLPTLPIPSGSDAASVKASLRDVSAKLAAEYTRLRLLQLAMTVNGMWRNVCALGIFDDKLWSTMEMSWQVILDAFAIESSSSSEATEAPTE